MKNIPKFNEFLNENLNEASALEKLSGSEITPDIVLKHGKVKFQFFSSYKGDFTYKELKGKAKIHGTSGSSQADMELIMTLEEIYNELFDTSIM